MNDFSLQSLATAIASATSPGDKIATAVRTLGDRAAIGTSGQLSGAVMIEMARSAGVLPRVYSIDTLRLFPETYAYMTLMEETYGVDVEWFRPDGEQLRKMVERHGEFLFFDSVAKQEYCCDVRKVHPNERALHTVDVWFTGLRRDQSGSRSELDEVTWVEAKLPNGEPHSILKVAPLIDWTEDQVRAYASEKDIPLHPLLQPRSDGWTYESLGCQICSTPSGPHEARRAGRWRWQSESGGNTNKECGIHLSFTPPNAAQ